MSEQQKRPTSLENALQVLKQFSIDEPEISVTSLAHKLNIAKSTAHRLLVSLAREEFVFKDPHSNLYSLGSTILPLANIVNSQIHISTEAIPILNSLAKETGFNAHLAILEGLDVVYLQTINGAYLFEDDVYPGNRVPAFCTSAGQSILAFQPELANESLNNLSKHTPQTVVDTTVFLEKLHQVRELGFAICTEEYQDKITGIGVPVSNQSGKIIASLSITAHSKNVSSADSKERVIFLLQYAAEKLAEIIKIRKGINPK